MRGEKGEARYFFKNFGSLREQREGDQWKECGDDKGRIFLGSSCLFAFIYLLFVFNMG